MKATITLEDTKTGDVTITCEFSEPVPDDTQSVSALFTMAIMMCACKAGGVCIYPPEGSETNKYAVSSGEHFREALQSIRNRIMATAGDPHGK